MPIITLKLLSAKTKTKYENPSLNVHNGETI